MIKKVISALKNLVKKYQGYQQDLKSNQIHSPVFFSLQQKVHGLHELLIKNPKIISTHFSLLAIVEPTIQTEHLNTFLNSVFSLSGDFELVLGIQPHVSETTKAGLLKRAEKNPRLKTIILQQPEGSTQMNALVEASSGNFIVLLNASAWVRPDLLYCYHLTLQAQQQHFDNVILYADEFEINAQGKFVTGSFFRKPPACRFPYLSANFCGHPLGFSKALWSSLRGFETSEPSAAEFDFVLRAESNGAQLVHVPIFLYAGRSEVPSSVAPTRRNQENSNSQKVLQQYFERKNIPLQVILNSKSTIQIKAPLVSRPTVQVVIPFKDNFEMTLRCLHLVFQQTEVDAKVSLIDNRSKSAIDLSALPKEKIELIRNDESFNYSRLNNLIMTESHFWNKCDYVFFLNNDVDLTDPSTISEMAGWASLPNVGACGIKLLYQNGNIQHGGIFTDYDSRARSSNWAHYGVDVQGYSNFLHSADAVTAAALLMRKELFQEIGGFDEIFYPIAYSDTDLCLRLRAKGLHLIYNPYLSAIHYESASRGSMMIEEFEESTWLMKLLGRNL